MELLDVTEDELSVRGSYTKPEASDERAVGEASEAFRKVESPEDADATLES